MLQAEQQLHQTLFQLWRFGSNALIGWSPSAHGIEVITMPKVRAFGMQAPHRRVFGGDRLFGPKTFQEVSRSLSLQPVELRLGAAVGDGPEDISILDIERVFSPFSITKTEHRAVFQLDIVGFSKLRPEQQASQLSTLEFCLNIAAETLKGQGLELSMGRSTTGDGYYVWNKLKGAQRDINLFGLFIVFCIIHSALRRTNRIPDAIPIIRSSISIGSHYSYSEPSRELGLSTEYIVGDVTITTARLLGAALAEQIIVGDFRRPVDGSDSFLDVGSFLAEVGRMLTDLDDMTILGSRLERLSLYVTGPKVESGDYSKLQIKVIDKHGFEHASYNAKVNAYLTNAEPFFCGLQHAELAQQPQFMK